MNARTDIQVLTGADGKPAFVVIAYDQYLRLQRSGAATVPHEVASRVLERGMSPARAWREYLGLTQQQLAKRLQISQSALAKLEGSHAAQRASTRQRLARALGIDAEALDW